MTLTLAQWERRLLDVNVDRLALPAVEASANEGVEFARRIVHKRSHKLEESISIDSIGSDAGGAEAEYSAKTVYARIEEEGNASRGPHPYMLPSARFVTPKLKRRAEVIGIEALTRSLT